MELDDKDEILFCSFEDNVENYHPKFILFINHELKCVILAIRGTFSLDDVIIDLVCEEDIFLDGYAHGGILKSAKKILELVEDILKTTLDKFPEYELVVTGHSLGAGSGILVTLAILNGETVIEPHAKVKCLRTNTLFPNKYVL